ncbi:uncharacterized protein LOC117178524 [Belonocnema kinseyi]|uniref:uncharacterized protein LOC117178524 n=1 Tax=Belonocnema kinseyi TaxID=2817044 RepID=UPI00143D858A|nr:uncharacterized protein LOC117178524 [Belonocnema kinseyi]
MSSTIKSTKNGKSGKSKKSIEYPIVDLGTPNPIEYQLSNELFAKLGWTVMPTKRSTRKIVQYQAQTAKPHLDWFQMYRLLGSKYYDEDKTKVLVDFHPDGSGKVFYPNSRLAVEILRSKKRKRNDLDIVTLYIVFTPGGKDIIGVSREPQITAIFDSIGNGMVMSEEGEIRLSYNQLGGICFDTPVGIPYLWHWTKNSKKPELEIVFNEPDADHLVRQFFSSTNKASYSSTGKETPKSIKCGSKKDKVKAESRNNKDSEKGKEKLEDENKRHWVDSKRNVKFDKPSRWLKPVFLKINKYLCLRIHDRRNINLQFLANGKSIRIELGTKLNLNKEISTYNTEFTNLKTELLKCRFLSELEEAISTNKIQELLKAQLKAKKFGAVL